MENEKAIKEELVEGENVCLGVNKPTHPPAGHYNGYWSCTDTGWQWFDSIEAKVYGLDGKFVRDFTEDEAR